MMRGVLAAGLIAGAGMLAGCTPPAAPGGAAGPGVPPPSDACGASKLQALVGQPLSWVAEPSAQGVQPLAIARIGLPGDDLARQDLQRFLRFGYEFLK